MKHKFAFSFLTLSIFSLFLFTSSLFAEVKPETEERPYDLSLVHLIANPEKYHNQWVRVVGFVHIKFEDHAVYLTKDDANYLNTANAFWIDFDEQANIKDVLQYDQKMCLIEGIFDSHSHGHLGMFPGTIKQIKRVVIKTKYYND